SDALDSMDYQHEPDAVGQRSIHPTFHVSQRRGGQRAALPLHVLIGRWPRSPSTLLVAGGEQQDLRLSFATLDICVQSARAAQPAKGQGSVPPRLTDFHFSSALCLQLRNPGGATPIGNVNRQFDRLVTPS